MKVLTSQDFIVCGLVSSYVQEEWWLSETSREEFRAGVRAGQQGLSEQRLSNLTEGGSSRDSSAADSASAGAGRLRFCRSS